MIFLTANPVSIIRCILFRDFDPEESVTILNDQCANLRNIYGICLTLFSITETIPNPVPNGLVKSAVCRLLKKSCLIPCSCIRDQNPMVHCFAPDHILFVNHFPAENIGGDGNQNGGKESDNQLSAQSGKKEDKATRQRSDGCKKHAIRHCGSPFAGEPLIYPSDDNSDKYQRNNGSNHVF